MDPMQLLQFLMQQQGTNPAAEQAAAIRRAPGPQDYGDLQPPQPMATGPTVHATMGTPEFQSVSYDPDAQRDLSYDAARDLFVDQDPRLPGETTFAPDEAKRMAKRGPMRPSPKQPAAYAQVSGDD